MTTVLDGNVHNFAVEGNISMILFKKIRKLFCEAIPVKCCLNIQLNSSCLDLCFENSFNAINIVLGSVYILITFYPSI